MNLFHFRWCARVVMISLWIVSGAALAEEKEPPSPTVDETASTKMSAKAAADTGTPSEEEGVSDEVANSDVAAAAEEASSAPEASDTVKPETNPEDDAKSETEVVPAPKELTAETLEDATKNNDAKNSQTAGGQTDVAAASSADAIKSEPKTDNFIAKAVPRTDRIVNILTSQTTRLGAMTLTIDHRAHESFLSGEDAWFDYLGLDAGNLKIGIGLRVGLKEYMDVGFYRLNNAQDPYDVYEFDTRLRFLKQENSVVNASLRIGGTWFVQKDAKDAAGFFAQVNVDRRFFGTLLLGTGFALHTDSSNEYKHYENEDASGAVLGYAEWRPVRKFSLNAEMAATVAGYGAKYPFWAFSFRFLTYRHAFSLVISDSQYMSADGFVANSWRAFDEIVFGFQIVREFQLVDY